MKKSYTVNTTTRTTLRDGQIRVDVIAKCILGIPTDNKYYYWQELYDFKLPREVDEEFK